MIGTSEFGCIGAAVGAVVLLLFLLAVGSLWDIRTATRKILVLLETERDKKRSDVAVHSVQPK